MALSGRKGTFSVGAMNAYDGAAYNKAVLSPSPASNMASTSPPTFLLHYFLYYEYVIAISTPLGQNYLDPKQLRLGAALAPSGFLYRSEIRSGTAMACMISVCCSIYARYLAWQCGSELQHQ
jgi:hypothetical protein